MLIEKGFLLIEAVFIVLFCVSMTMACVYWYGLIVEGKVSAHKRLSAISTIQTVYESIEKNNDNMSKKNIIADNNGITVNCALELPSLDAIPKGYSDKGFNRLKQIVLQAQWFDSRGKKYETKCITGAFLHE